MEGEYDSQAAFELSWQKQEKEHEAQEQRIREELGYDRLYDEFEAFLKCNPMEFKYNYPKKVFNAIFYDLVMRHDFYHVDDGEYDTNKLDFLATSRTIGGKLAIIGSYDGRSFIINPKSEVLHWSNNIENDMRFYL